MQLKPAFHAFADRDTMNRAVARRIEDQLARGIAADGRASLALSGGRTPGPIYQLLARSELDWLRLTVTLTDERLVPADSADSNAKLVNDTFLTGAPQARFVTLAAGPLAAPVLPLDVVVLGMGTDGHIASLFPGSFGLGAALDPAAVPACVRITPDPMPPEAPYKRLSLNLAALLSSRLIVLLLTGELKRGLFEKALEGGAETAMPVRAIINQGVVPVEVFWSP